MLHIFDRYQARKHQDEHEMEQGFTLIELLIVIVVLGILAAVTVFALNSVTGTSAVSACNSDAASVNTAEAAYSAQNSGSFATLLQLVPNYLQNSPSTAHYVISVNATTGAVSVVAPIVVPAGAAVLWTPGGSACSGAK